MFGIVLWIFIELLSRKEFILRSELEAQALAGCDGIFSNEPLLVLIGIILGGGIEAGLL